MISGLASPPRAPQAEDLTWTLLRIATEFLERLHRLHAAERQLALAVRRRHGDEARHAVHQVELERQRLGRELHTGVGQMLAAIRIQAEIVQAHIPAPPAAAREALERITTLAVESLDQVRSVSRRLQPPRWQRVPLEAALRQLWEISGVAARFESEVRIQPFPLEPDLTVKSLFYRSAQEALSNIMRHSHATRIQLVVQPVRNLLVLQVRDNGCGFDATRMLSAPAEAGAGIGLALLRDQARALGGKLLIKSGPHGTTLEVSIGFSQAST